MQLAAREILDQRGVGGFSVDAVAESSGVAKTTIYRHWPSAHHLMLDTVERCTDTLPTPNTGSLRDDLITLFGELMTSVEQNGMRTLMLDVLAQSSRDEALELAKEEMMGGHLQPVRTILELAQLRGEIRADLDLETVTDMVQGPLFFRRIVRGQQLSPPALAVFVDAIIAGLVRQPSA